jgi:hypothetical protein
MEDRIHSTESRMAAQNEAILSGGLGFRFEEVPAIVAQAGMEL